MKTTAVLNLLKSSWVGVMCLIIFVIIANLVICARAGRMEVLVLNIKSLQDKIMGFIFRDFDTAMNFLVPALLMAIAAILYLSTKWQKSEISSSMKG